MAARDTRRSDGVGPYLRFALVVLYPLTVLLFKVSWRHRERIPASGGAIIAVNHISYADPIVFGRFIWDAGRVPRYLAKASLFRAPFPVGMVIRGSGQIPVNRGTPDAGTALEHAVRALRQGQLVLIYPEGTVTRDPDWWPMQGKTGIARLALMVPEAPVIPVGQWGAQHFLDYYHKKLRPIPRTRVYVDAGEPVDLSDFHGQPASHEVLAAMTERIMVAVRDRVAGLRGEPAPEQFYRRPAGT
ncbi:MAG TPA: lysophospholipid acyltransferase family protein [Jatrophihabitans sp.]|nr:lysophospholipid acyltransferase family protein [Jatrophihabitans sp.]